MKKCEHCGATENEKGIKYNKKVGMYLCRKHDHQINKFDSFKDCNKRGVFDDNDIRISGNIAEIDTYDQFGNVLYTFEFDKCFVDIVENNKWRASVKRGVPYCVTTIKKSPVYLHALVLPGFDYVDHIDGDTKNNKLSNLRGCSNSDNLKNTKIRTDNTSGIKGVYKNVRGLWTFEIEDKGVRYYFKQFKTKEEAIVGRFYSEVLLHKEFRSNNDIVIDNVVNSLSIDSKISIYKYVYKKISGNRGY